MKPRSLIYPLTVFFISIFSACNASQNDSLTNVGAEAQNLQSSIEKQNIAVFEKMLSAMENLDASNSDSFLSHDCELRSDHRTMDFKGYKHQIETLKKSGRKIRIERPYGDLFSKGDRVAARIHITVFDKQNRAEETQIILIAQVLNGKIRRLWELTRSH